MAGEVPSNISRLLDKSLTIDLFDKVTVGAATYYFIDQSGEDEGEPLIVREVEGSPPEFVEGILPTDDTAGGAASNFSPALQERLAAMRGSEEDTQRDTAGGASALTQAELDEDLRLQAEKSGKEGSGDQLKSHDAPGTSGGTLACAWAVNRVAKLGLGKEIGGGLATAEMIKVLKNKHKALDAPVPGCIIISPTENTPNGRNIGHVGIVGEVGSQSSTKIYSNSSTKKRFVQNFSQESWLNRYKRDKGLKVFYFELDPALFPGVQA